jgi:integrating conjugative element protein (TIGR03765 family)
LPAHYSPPLRRYISGQAVHVRFPQKAKPPLLRPRSTPIRTPGLQLRGANPRKLRTRTLLGRPICVLGSDAYSAAWLRANAAAFKRGGAMCYVIQVESPAALAALRAQVPGIPLAAISGQVFVAAGLKGYPALITQSGAVQ